MALSLSTARYLAPASFFYNFAAQQYGIFSKPSMMDVHNANLSFFSPQPYFIAAFFFQQQLFQLAWLYRLWRLDASKLAQKKELDTIVKYVPYYAIGNVCFGTWMFFWNSSNLKTANMFVIGNTLTQLFYIATQLDPMDTSSTSSILTHVVSKTFAGIGVLDILHNSSVAYFKDQLPGTLAKVGTAVGFAGLGVLSDWIFGACLVYDLIGLAVGQAQINNTSWSQLLGAYAVGTAAIVGLRNFFKPPYVSQKAGYRAAAQDELDETV